MNNVSATKTAPQPMLEVLRCGILTSVQDLGRHGQRHLGISQCGALDTLALQQANLLLGNAPGAAGLEISVGPVHLRFHADAVIVLSGVDFAPTLHDPTGAASNDPVLTGHRVSIPAGSTLSLTRPAIPGARCYLAVAGGIDVPLVLGSRSTDLKAGFGGHEGRALEAGDLLPLGTARLLKANASRGVRGLAPTHVLRALPGPDYEQFTAASHTQFWMQPWRISHQSNRMGMRLNGASLQLRAPLSLLSSGVLPGDVQVPSDGLPIVLASDCQTIGGYPRIASVIRADLWQLAHLPPLTSVYFQPVTHAVARAALDRQTRYLARLAQVMQQEFGE